MKTKKLVLTAFTMVVTALCLIWLVGIEIANASDKDAFEISVTPLVTYAVSISTPANGLSFSNVDLNTAYVNASSATVTNAGNASADWTVKITALNNWTLGTTLADNGSDKAVLAAKFNTAATITGSYTDNDVLLVTEKNADVTNFAGDQNGNNVVKNAEKLLWIYVKTPTDTTYDTAQKFRVEVKAYTASKF